MLIQEITSIHAIDTFEPPEIVGLDTRIPLLDGSLSRYINLDNAASTPAFKAVKEKVDQALIWYSSVHRGAGYKSLLSTHLYEQCRQVVMDFVGADAAQDCVIFTLNTTHAINKLANSLAATSEEVVITTMMEHHSNDLPWRPKCKVVYAEILEDGSLDVEDFRSLLDKYKGKVKLVAVSGASNVSGFMNPIYDLAEMAHQYGARIFVDCAQLAPHRAIHMGRVGEARRLDFIAFSAHKMYAPFGSGVLVGEKLFFTKIPPDYRGGGTIEVVTQDEVFWAEAPERFEAGSPNVIGAIALAASMRQLTEIGMQAIARHEASLTTYALEQMNKIDGVKIYGSRNPSRVEDRLGVITFEVPSIPHGKVAAILSFEGGIAVRNGCFCAHPYVLRLMGISHEDFEIYKQQALAHDRTHLPGMLRISFGCYNTLQEVDLFIDMLQHIVSGEYQGDYVQDPFSGSYLPRGFDYHTFDQTLKL